APQPQLVLKRSQLEWRRATMKARQLIDGAPFGPEALKVIGQAFAPAGQQSHLTSAMNVRPLTGRGTRWPTPCCKHHPRHAASEEQSRMGWLDNMVPADLTRHPADNS